jgi:hypothetical protein
MITVKAKHVMCGDLVELLGKYPSLEEQMFLLDQLALLSGVASRSTQASKPTISQAVAKPLAKTALKQSKGSSNKGDSAERSSEEKTEKPDLDLVDPRNYSGGSHLVKVLQSESTLAERQIGASKPRMDHKSIRNRAAAVRKQLRKAKKAASEGEKGKPSLPPSLAKVLALVNATKSLRLVFIDAFKAKIPVNVGNDLLTDFPSPEDFENLVLMLGKGGLVKNKVTHFWEDTKGVLPSTLSQGEPSEVTPNPFAA